MMELGELGGDPVVADYLGAAAKVAVLG